MMIFVDWEAGCCGLHPHQVHIICNWATVVLQVVDLLIPETLDFGRRTAPVALPIPQELTPPAARYAQTKM
jgi:hypothetical protein